MKEFIDAFGYRNFVILLIVVALIVVSLIVLFVIDRISSKKEDKSINIKKVNKKISKLEKGKTEEESTNKNEIVKKDDIVKENAPVIESERIVYVDKKDEEELAKKTLNDTLTKLKEIKESGKENVELIDNTEFEKEQEERSIISYEELKEASKNVDATNDMLLEDEGNEPITIDELYERHEESQYESPDDLENPIFTDTLKEVNKFKKSEVISPVFGVYKKNYDNYSVEKYYNTMDLKDIELEIKKTEEFLEELKKIRNKLD